MNEQPSADTFLAYYGVPVYFLYILAPIWNRLLHEKHCEKQLKSDFEGLFKQILEATGKKRNYKAFEQACFSKLED